MATNGKARRRIGFTRARGWCAAAAGIGALALPATAHADPPAVTPAALGGASAVVGQELNGAATVTGSQPLTVAYQWESCNDLACQALPGATGERYSPSAFDVGQRLRVVVTASNDEAPGGVTQASDQTAPVQQPTPREAAPTLSGTAISGTAAVGQTLTATTDPPGGDPLPGLAYVWQRCDAGGGSCQDVGNAQSYGVVVADIGSTLRVNVTADNGIPPAATGTALSGIVPIPLQAPQFVAGPAITGSAVVGQTLNVGAVAIGVPLPDIEYTWWRCSPACAQVGTGSSYTLVAADTGATMKVTARAFSTAGEAAQESAPTAAVAAAPAAPVITGGPTIAGTPALNQPLTASATASGNPAPTITYTWVRCDAAGNSCNEVLDIDLPGEQPRYVLGPLDVGQTVRVLAVATNALGSSAPQPSAAVGPIPGIAGDVQGVGISPATALTVGVTLRAGATATGTPPPTVTYQWRRCSGASNATCQDIAGATAVTYTLTADDVGFRLRVRVSAVNAYGGDDDLSDDTAVVAAPPAQPTPPAPPGLATPSISGVAVVGQVMTADAAATGSPPPALAFQWQRCDAAGNACQDIAGAAGPQRTVLDADRGATLRVVVTATNGQGPDATKTSPVTPVIAAAGPGGILPVGTGFDTTTSAAALPPTGRAALSPFPQVRIRGKLVRGGARVTLFSITAPVGARISIHCTGRGCPKVFVRNARRAVTRVGRYERFLRAGLRIKVRVSRTGFVGKYSSFVIRDRKAPVRTDLCLPSPTAKPVRCAT